MVRKLGITNIFLNSRNSWISGLPKINGKFFLDKLFLVNFPFDPTKIGYYYNLIVLKNLFVLANFNNDG